MTPVTAPNPYAVPSGFPMAQEEHWVCIGQTWHCCATRELANQLMQANKTEVLWYVIATVNVKTVGVFGALGNPVPASVVSGTIPNKAIQIGYTRYEVAN